MILKALQNSLCALNNRIDARGGSLPNNHHKGRKGTYLSLLTFALIVTTWLLVLMMTTPNNKVHERFLRDIDYNESTNLSSVADKDEYAPLCVLVRNQIPDLIEFLIHHYYHVGIRRFYIMDDGTDPPLSTLTDQFGIPPETITFYYNPYEREKRAQDYLIDKCFKLYGNKHTWLGIIDADEFIEMTGTETLVTFLKSFESDPKVGAVAVQWNVHTSNGLLYRPPSTRKAYTACAADDPNGENKHFKSFVRTAYYESPITPHNFVTNSSTHTVGESGDILSGYYPYRNPISRNRITLHHYEWKSKEEYAEKMERGNAGREPRSWNEWNHYSEEISHVPCLSMTKYDP
jgi:hypothetical protein